ncbi:DUF1559 domain-containing protein [bacterium]|nr:MAG: DUF1559 domain-containing protein [bacterium]
MKNTLSTKTRSTGFTLIELLVVIAIIAILAAILFPVFGRARANARRSSGLSNIKQIGLGLTQYLQDYDERFPATVTERQGGNPADPNVAALYSIRAKLQPYVKSTQIFKDPSGPDWPAPTTGAYFPTDYGFQLNEGPLVANVGNIVPAAISTAQSQWYVTNPTFGFNHQTTLASIPSSAEFIIAADAARPADPNNPSRGGLYPFADGNITTSAADGQFPFSGGVPYAGTQAGPSIRHLGGTNFLFADGHAKWMRLEKSWVSITNNYWRTDRP